MHTRARARGFVHPLMRPACAAWRACGRYLFLFLKFISAVCPTIEYDYTISVDGL